MPNVDFDAIAKGIAMAVPFVGHLGLEITEIGAGEATVRLPRRPELTNHLGSQHTGALFTAAEIASGAAFVGAFAVRIRDISAQLRTAEISIEKPAAGPILASARLGIEAADALAELDAEGRIEFPCEVELRDRQGATVAVATFDWQVSLKQPPA